MSMAEVRLHEETAQMVKDPEQRKVSKDKAAKPRGPAQAQPCKYEKCRKSARR